MGKVVVVKWKNLFKYIVTIRLGLAKFLKIPENIPIVVIFDAISLFSRSELNNLAVNDL